MHVLKVRDVVRHREVKMNPKLTEYISSLNTEEISAERMRILQPLINFIESKKSVVGNKEIHLIFICTHNSRRSHLAHIWAQTMAAHFGQSRIHCYSGGTESTAVYPQVLAILTEVGFEASKTTNTENPIYKISFSDEHATIEAFSKRWDDGVNPKKEFAAVMTCTHADENCPFIPGAKARISITYDDPKEFDYSPLKGAKYRELSRQIASEMRFVFEQLGSGPALG